MNTISTQVPKYRVDSMFIFQTFHQLLSSYGPQVILTFAIAALRNSGLCCAVTLLSRNGSFL